MVFRSSKDSSRAQGAIEYLLIIGAAILVAAIVIPSIGGVLDASKLETISDANETEYGMKGLKDMFDVSVAEAKGEFNPSLRNINSFGFLGVNVVSSVFAPGNNIIVTVPEGTPKTLAPSISISTGASIIPANNTLTDFTNPVDYTVTSKDGNVQNYRVSLVVQGSTANFILDFNFNSLTPAAVGTFGPANTIFVTVPFGTNITSITPTINISPNATIIPSGPRNFTSPVVYTVTPQAGSIYKKSYTVSVTVRQISTKTINSFSFSGLSPVVNGTIGGDYNISLTVPKGTNVTNLVPTIIYSGVSIIPQSGIAQNFSSPVDYNVSAEDGSIRKYKVKVNVFGCMDVNASNYDPFATISDNSCIYQLVTGANLISWTTPNYPGNYPDNINVWSNNYACPQNEIVKNIDYNICTELGYDFLYIKNRDKTSLFRTESSCGRTSTGEYNTNTLAFNFVSDPYVNAKGVGNIIVTCGALQTDNSPPIVSLYYPKTSYNIPGPSVKFAFFVSDNVGLKKCILSDNGIPFAILNSVSNYNYNYYNYDANVGGTHSWDVNCMDAAGNSTRTASSPFTVYQKSMLLEYKFENNSFDTSGNKFDGNWNKTPKYVSGVVGQAADLNGTAPIGNYINAGSISTLNSNRSQISIGFWVKPRTAKDSYFLTKASKLNSYLGPYIIGLNADGAPWAKVNLNTWSTLTTTGDVNIVDGQWHYITYVYDNYGDGSETNESKLYIDGQLDVVVQWDLFYYLNAPSSELWIGGISNDSSSNNWYDGAIDEVRIYNYSLSSAEILSYYVANKPN